VSRDDANGTLQPFVAQYDCICASGMFDTVRQLTPPSTSVVRSVTLAVKCVQPGQNASGPLSMNW